MLIGILLCASRRIYRPKKQEKSANFFYHYFIT